MSHKSYTMGSRKVTLVDYQDAKCPFCGLICTFGVTSENESVAIHQMPQCQVFDQSDPSEFLMKVNDSLGRKSDA
jgi:hypothetical protein